MALAPLSRLQGQIHRRIEEADESQSRLRDDALKLAEQVQCLSARATELAAGKEELSVVLERQRRQHEAAMKRQCEESATALAAAETALRQSEARGKEQQEALDRSLARSRHLERRLSASNKEARHTGPHGTRVLHTGDLQHTDPSQVARLREELQQLQPQSSRTPPSSPIHTSDIERSKRVAATVIFPTEVAASPQSLQPPTLSPRLTPRVREVASARGARLAADQPTGTPRALRREPPGRAAASASAAEQESSPVSTEQQGQVAGEIASRPTTPRWMLARPCSARMSGAANSTGTEDGAAAGHSSESG